MEQIKNHEDYMEMLLELEFLLELEKGIKGKKFRRGTPDWEYKQDVVARIQEWENKINT